MCSLLMLSHTSKKKRKKKVTKQKSLCSFITVLLSAQQGKPIEISYTLFRGQICYVKRLNKPAPDKIRAFSHEGLQIQPTALLPCLGKGSCCQCVSSGDKCRMQHEVNKQIFISQDDMQVK